MPAGPGWERDAAPPAPRGAGAGADVGGASGGARMKGAGGGRASAGLQEPVPALALLVGLGFFLTYFPTCPGTGSARPVGPGKAQGQPWVWQKGGGGGTNLGAPSNQIQPLGCVPKAA